MNQIVVSFKQDYFLSCKYNCFIGINRCLHKKAKYYFDVLGNKYLSYHFGFFLFLVLLS